MLKSQNENVACFSLWHTYSFGANKKKQPKLLFFYLALCNSSSERSVNEAYSAG
jgi:TPR repeat protein